jgi:hypothetical protein
VIGLIPEICLLEAGNFVQQSTGSEHADKDVIIAQAINYMGLDRLKPFLPEEKILERVLAKYIQSGK